MWNLRLERDIRDTCRDRVQRWNGNGKLYQYAARAFIRAVGLAPSRNGRRRRYE